MKRKQIVASVLSALMVSAVAAGCQSGSSTASQSTAAGSATGTASAAATAAKSGSKKIGFVTKTMSNPYWVFIQQEVKREVEAKGDTLVAVDPEGDSAKQMDQVNDLISQKVDVIMIAPIDSQAICPVLKQAKNSSIPVVDFDIPVNDATSVSAIVTSDNTAAGKQSGEYMKTQLPKGSKIAIIDFPSNTGDNQRVAGFKSAVGDYFQIVSQLDGKANTGDTLPKAEDVLQSTPDLKAFFTINDPTALGCVQAIGAMKKTGQVGVYSVDGSPAGKADIQKGLIVATTAQFPKEEAQATVQLAYDLLAGKTVQAKTTINTELINKDNVSKYGVDTWQ